MSTRDEIAQQALSLPPDDRAFLADILEQSLTDAEFTTTEIALAWTKEIDRRLDAYDRGEIDAVDARSAIDEMRRALAERRAGKAT
jgi:putative addiction module component (TIGR02574 family)